MPQLGTHAALYSAPSLVVPLFSLYSGNVLTQGKAAHIHVRHHEELVERHDWTSIAGRNCTSNQRSRRDEYNTTL